jgi:hypothetical protein
MRAKTHDDLELFCVLIAVMPVIAVMLSNSRHRRHELH